MEFYAYHIFVYVEANDKNSRRKYELKKKPVKFACSYSQEQTRLELFISLEPQMLPTQVFA